MNIQVGDLFVTSNKKVLHLVLKVHDSLVYTEWNYIETEEKCKTTLTYSDIERFLSTKTFKHYPVVK